SRRAASSWTNLENDGDHQDGEARHLEHGAHDGRPFPAIAQCRPVPFHKSPNRAAAYDGDVCAQEFSASHTRSGVAGMLMCLPPSASTMAFITEGSEPAQPASPQPLAPSTLVLAGTE